MHQSAPEPDQGQPSAGGGTQPPVVEEVTAANEPPAPTLPVRVPRASAILRQSEPVRAERAVVIPEQATESVPPRKLAATRLWQSMSQRRH